MHKITMDKAKLSMIVTGASILLSLALAFAGIPHTISCNVAQLAASVAHATSTK